MSWYLDPFLYVSGGWGIGHRKGGLGCMYTSCRRLLLGACCEHSPNCVHGTFFLLDTSLPTLISNEQSLLYIVDTLFLCLSFFSSDGVLVLCINLVELKVSRKNFLNFLLQHLKFRSFKRASQFTISPPFIFLTSWSDRRITKGSNT